MRRGIILAGGTGSRLFPATIGVNKQMLPVYDKPMIYYPLSTLMQSDCREIMIISTKKDMPNYKKLLGDGKSLGIKIFYKIQPKPNGIAAAFILAEKFLKNRKSILILGDNIFFGNQLEMALKKNNNNNGSTIFLYNVKNPEAYGVAQIKNNKIKKIVEKPKKYISNKAITGLYFFDENVSHLAKKIKYSARGELEITDLINLYLQKKKLRYEIIDKGNAWLDAGTHNDLLESSMYVKTLQHRLGLMVGSVHEIAFKKGWINSSVLKKNLSKFGKNDYYSYLKRLINEKN